MPELVEPPVLLAPRLAEHLARRCSHAHFDLRSLVDAEAGLRDAALRLAAPLVVDRQLDAVALARARSLALDGGLRGELAAHRRRRRALMSALAAAAERPVPRLSSVRRAGGPVRGARLSERSAKVGAALSRLIVLERAPPALARTAAPALDDVDEIVRIVGVRPEAPRPPAPPGASAMLEIAVARLELTLGLVITLLAGDSDTRAEPWLLDALAARAVGAGTLARGILGIGAVAASPARTGRFSPRHQEPRTHEGVSRGRTMEAPGRSEQVVPTSLPEFSESSAESPR